ncbi:hypothetical protein PoB_007571500 [Plakobranchus ocellatus]|uniref:Uncharacterized protein n=1 Tax=Plakobranchus ocellatus TaxID=259542 RepID=A0AAV4DYE2_9GAST|nr:hypothetical protein PoB_007571500 [Plakobranchus ocellatus]
MGLKRAVRMGVGIEVEMGVKRAVRMGVGIEVEMGLKLRVERVEIRLYIECKDDRKAGGFKQLTPNPANFDSKDESGLHLDPSPGVDIRDHPDHSHQHTVFNRRVCNRQSCGEYLL